MLHLILALIVVPAAADPAPTIAAHLGTAFTGDAQHPTAAARAATGAVRPGDFAPICSENEWSGVAAPNPGEQVALGHVVALPGCANGTGSPLPGLAPELSGLPRLGSGPLTGTVMPGVLRLRSRSR